MYNYLKKRLYEKYKTVTGINSDITNFYDDDGYLVATLYRKEQVLNIFLSCSEDVIWNHHNLAIFVVARKYSVVDKGKERITEAAWLIGALGATWQYTLSIPYYLCHGCTFLSEDDSLVLYGKSLSSQKGWWKDEILETSTAKGISCIYKTNKGYRFKLFDLKIEWQGEDKQLDHELFHLNPALIYPLAPGGKKIKNLRGYLMHMERVHHESFSKLECIDINKTNHLDFSKISYHRVN